MNKIIEILKSLSLTKKMVINYFIVLMFISFSFYVYSMKIVYPNFMKSEHNTINTISNMILDDINTMILFDSFSSLDEMRVKVLKNKKVIDLIIKHKDYSIGSKMFIYSKDNKIELNRDKEYFTKYVEIGSDSHFVIIYSASDYLIEINRFTNFSISMMVFILISLLILIYLQRVLLAPIIELTYTVKDIDFSSNNYRNVKFPKVLLNDERRLLVDSVNGLYLKVLSYLSELENINEVLEDRVKNRTKELEIAKVKAEESNRIKSEFIANISHEFRTPLNSIINFSNLITAESRVDKEYIKSINQSSSILLMLVNDILDMSAIEANRLEIKPTEVNLYSMVLDVKNMFILDLEKKSIDLDVNIESNKLYYLMLDKLRLKQVLINLISNAVKFTNKGFIKVNISLLNLRDNKLDLTIVIEDSGIGIDKVEHSKIFDAFTQTHISDTKQYEGTGLGLAITKRLLKLMSATISLESELNKGSKFTLSFNDISYDKNNLIDLDNIIFYDASDLDSDIEDIFTPEQLVIFNDKFLSKKLLPLIKEAKSSGSIDKIIDCSILLNFMIQHIESKYLVKLTLELKNALLEFNIVNIERILLNIEKFILGNGK